MFNQPVSTSAATVAGVNFGSYDLTPTSSVSYGKCATTAWASASSVACFSPSSVKLSEATVEVTLASKVGQNSETVPSTGTFTYDSPVVSASSPDNMPSSLGPATVRGFNFAC
jgi:hypothetical protein